MSRHTPECVAARGGPDVWPKVGDLGPRGLAAVLACPDEAHDSVRRLCAHSLSRRAEARP